MAIKKCFAIFLVFQIALVLFSASAAKDLKLKLGYYEAKCPGIEKFIWKKTSEHIFQKPGLAASLLRLHFHDCFVRGCDASVLLNSIKAGPAEKASPPNLSLRGFEVIDSVKAAVEKKCPNVVSCADILSLVARDAVHLINGPFWEVPTGRRDGRISTFQEPLVNLPPPFGNITVLKRMFAAKGLNVKDLAILSGGHTIGISLCSSFSNRLYNFTGKGDTDPSLDPKYVISLKKKCSPKDATTVVPMERTPKTFDREYYNTITQKRGLFESDAALLNDATTKAYVLLQASAHKTTFNQDFAASMVKMGKIGVLTGKKGEIRKKCYVVNK